MKNYDSEVVADFGKEWSAFNQQNLNEEEWLKIAQSYFLIFPWDKLPVNPKGIDLGCGSGRWAKYVAPKVLHLTCLDASNEALNVAKKNLNNFENITFIHSTIDGMPIKQNSMDFAYSLGVLHHIPDTESALKSAVKILKPGAPILIYLYYNFEGKPQWYKDIWKISDILRKNLATKPYFVKLILSNFLAFFVYFPLARLSKFFQKLKLNSSNIPLNFYADKSLYTMRTDSLDRFATRLEKRFSRDEVENLMSSAGLVGIDISDSSPYWCAVGFKSIS